MWVALDWIEAHCIVPDGFKRGKPFRLYDYQGRYLKHFYMVRPDAVWNAEHPLLSTAFVYRRGILVAPQKIGKNPMIAAQVCLEGVGPSLFAGWAQGGELYRCRDWGCRCGFEHEYQPGDPMGMPRPTPLIQITAFSEDSTGNTYDALRPMIDLGPLHDLIPHTGEEMIRLPDLWGTGAASSDNACLIETVTSSAQSRLGQRVTFVPQDELGLWTAANKMQHVADTQYRGLAGMGGRASLTTNAWDPAQKSVAQREYESKAEDVYRQFVRPPRHLSYTNKEERRRIHRIVYESDTIWENGGHVNLDSIEAEAAGMLEHDEAQAKRFFGNILTAGAGSAVEADLYDRLAAPRDVPAGTYIGLGFDGSLNKDSSALRGCTRDGYHFTVKVWERPRGDEMIRWQAEHPGQEWAVPRLDVMDTVAQTFERYKVGRFFYDPPWWRTEGLTWASLYGEEIVLALDSYSAQRMGAAVDRWRTDMREGRYCHDGDPVASAHIKAAHLQKFRSNAADADGHTLYRLAKGDDAAKIDASIADVLSHEAAATMPDELPTTSESVWNTERRSLTL